MTYLGGNIMRMFKTARGYVGVCCICVLFALWSLHGIGRQPLPAQHVPFLVTDMSVFNVLEILFVLYIVVVLVGLVRKISNHVERAIIALAVAMCVIVLVEILPKVGLAMISIPYEHHVSFVIECVAATLVGIRAFTVARGGETA